MVLSGRCIVCGALLAALHPAAIASAAAASGKLPPPPQLPTCAPNEACRYELPIGGVPPFAPCRCGGGARECDNRAHSRSAGGMLFTFCTSPPRRPCAAGELSVRRVAWRYEHTCRCEPPRLLVSRAAVHYSRRDADGNAGSPLPAPLTDDVTHYYCVKDKERQQCAAGSPCAMRRRGSHAGGGGVPLSDWSALCQCAQGDVCAQRDRRRHHKLELAFCRH